MILELLDRPQEVRDRGKIVVIIVGAVHHRDQQVDEEDLGDDRVGPE